MKEDIIVWHIVKQKKSSSLIELDPIYVYCMHVQIVSYSV